MDTSSSAKQHYEELKQKINRHNHLYHVEDAPVISDADYDKLMVELRQIEDEYPDWVMLDSPSQRVGAALSERFEKVRHPRPILSLANAFGAQDARAWYERVRKLDDRVEKVKFVVEPKIDGLSVVLHYRDGLFVQGATRGDGEIGEDITVNLRTVKAIPLRIPLAPNPSPSGRGEGVRVPNYLVIRGEAFIPIKEFDKLNQKLAEAGKETYLNPRNTAAGSLRQFDPSITASRPLTLLVYQVVYSEGGRVPSSQWELLEWLSALGFPVTDVVRRFDDIESAIAYTLTWDKRRNELPYEADGMVIKIDDLDLADELGFVGKDPRGAIAFKFPAREVTMELLGIEVEVGRTGVLTPRATLKPVEINGKPVLFNGVNIRNATLHNFDYIAEKDIRVGDRVLVKRAGEVIPYVIGPVADLRTGAEKPYIPPNTCPTCGQPVEHFAGEVAWYCVNAACPAQLVRNIEHFVSKGAMDIDGLGTEYVGILIDTGKIHDVADLYTLNTEDLLVINQELKRRRRLKKPPKNPEKVQIRKEPEKRPEKLWAAIDASKNRPLPRLLTALGVRGVGEVSARDLAAKFLSLDALATSSEDQLRMVEGIGPNIAKAIVDWFGRERNQKVLEKLRDAGVWPVNQQSIRTNSQSSGPLSGMTFVVTGTLPILSREGVKEFIETHGGKVTDSVSKNTSYLVLGEAPGSKYEKAKALGVKIIDEVELRKLVERG